MASHPSSWLWRGVTELLNVYPGRIPWLCRLRYHRAFRYDGWERSTSRKVYQSVGLLTHTSKMSGSSHKKHGHICCTPYTSLRSTLWQGGHTFSCPPVRVASFTTRTANTQGRKKQQQISPPSWLWEVDKLSSREGAVLAVAPPFPLRASALLSAFPPFWPCIASCFLGMEVQNIGGKLPINKGGLDVCCATDPMVGQGSSALATPRSFLLWLGGSSGHA